MSETTGNINAPKSYNLKKSSAKMWITDINMQTKDNNVNELKLATTA